ncbi:MAG: hypothetical protein U1E45_17120 [Geminicoccaceae bacterium]
MITLAYAIAVAAMYLAVTWYLVLLKRDAKKKRRDIPLRWYDRASCGRDQVAKYAPIGFILLMLIEDHGAAPLVVNAGGLLLAASMAVYILAYVRFPVDRLAGALSAAAILLLSGAYGLAGAWGVLMLVRSGLPT